MGLFLTIVGLITIGAIITYAVSLTFRWLKNKIKEKLAAKRVKKVAVADLEELIDKCENRVSVDALDNLVNEGYSHVMVEVDNNNKIDNVEVIQDTNDYLDEDVKRLLGSQGMVVVEG